MEKRLPFVIAVILSLTLALAGVRWLTLVLTHQQHDAHMLAKARQLGRVVALYPQTPPPALWDALTDDADIHAASLYVEGQPRLQTRNQEPGIGDYQRVELRLTGQRLLSLTFYHHPMPWQQVFVAMLPMLLGVLLLLWLLFRLARSCWQQRQQIATFETEAKSGQVAQQGSFPEARARLLGQQKRIHTLEAQQQQLDGLLHSAAWLDERTGLGNRLFFEQRLATWLQESEGNRIGCVMLLELSHLDGVADSDFEPWQRQLVQLLQDKAQGWPDAVLSRLDDDEYGLLLPQMPTKDGQSFALGLIKDLERLPKPKGLTGNDWLHLGWTLYQAGDDTALVLDKTAMALRGAQLQGENAVMAADVESMPQVETGSVRWRTLLDQVLGRQSVNLVTEPVHSLDGDVHHLRVRALITDPKGQKIDDSVFMPMACRVGQEEAMTKLCLQLLLAKLDQARNRGHRLVFRVCVDALLKPGFSRWLQLALLEVRDLLPQLMLSVTEFELAQHGKTLAEPLRQLGTIGVGVAVERLGQHSKRSPWQDIPPRMLKLHSSMVRQIHRNSEQQLWVQRLVQKAVDSNTEVVATGIVDNDERLCLQRLGVSAGEGPLFGHGAWDPL
ncbi:EAL domain-containing protein [Gallaecimonas pentaromativorans]|uniref:EAL domain-containing protein n=1 Tax=Gallaecimonas pentaromativorans TaxID=584787 RepID=UPI003A926A11